MITKPVDKKVFETTEEEKEEFINDCLALLDFYKDKKNKITGRKE